jgi:hypothetical protein
MIAVGAFLLLPRLAVAQELTDDEVSCMARSSFLMAGVAPRFTKCVVKCVHRIGPVHAPARCTLSGACAAGATDPTCRCYLKGLAHVERTQSLRCADCPECYESNGNDPNPECGSDAEEKSATLVSYLESLLLTGTPSVFCNDSQSINGHSLRELQCQLATAKALGWLAKQHALCNADCRERERAGQVAPGSCTPPLLSNANAPTTAKNCILQSRIKALAQLQGRCAAIEGGQTPACHAGREEIDWVTVIEDFVDAQDPTFFCGFPSPAFLD